MSEQLDRRAFVRGLSAVSLAGSLPACVHTSYDPDGWGRADDIRAAIREPSIPAVDFDVRNFGAEPGTDCSLAIAAAIVACEDAGGGRIVFTGGTYLTGPIHLRSRMALHLEGDARLQFIPEPERYLPPVLTHWEGLEFMGLSPLIYAQGQSDIAITGSGTIDGGAGSEHWWPWAYGNSERNQRPARAQLMRDAEDNVPVEERIYAEDAYLRPPLIQPFGCQRVLIEGVTIRNSPFWLINPVLCQDVTVRDVFCESLGPNSDGCNPESCRRVLIEGCRFNTGDDCIAIKSGRNADGRRIATPCEDIVISNCEMQAGHGGVVIGSEISGGVRYVFAENCRMSSPDLERAIRIKTNSIRGGLLEHLRYRNIEVGQVRDAIVINYFYEEGDAGTFDPIVRDVLIENLRVDQAERVFQIRGFDRDPVQDLELRNVRVRNAGSIGIVENVDGFVTENVRINGEPFIR